MLRHKLSKKRKQDADSVHETKRKPQINEKTNILYTPDSEDDRQARLEEAVLGVAEDVLDTLSQGFESYSKSQHKEIEEVPQKKWEDSDDEDVDRNDLEVDNPSWATNYEERESDDSDEEVLKSHTQKILTTSTSLPPSSLAFKRVTDANKEDPTMAALSAVQFHPKATVILTGSLDSTVRLFAVDGCKNRKIHSMYLERTPVKGAKFSRGGSEIIIGSVHKSFYIYDMEGSTGMTFRPRMKGLEAAEMGKFEISPDERFIAFVGKQSCVHLFSQKSKELIETVKANGIVMSIKFSNDGKYLYCFTDDGDVYVWDLNTRSCVHRFNDDGCSYGQCLEVSPDGKYIALGSKSGIVNLYDHQEAMSSASPRPLKHIKNLTMPCDQALFNSHSELLALKARDHQAGIKLMHFPSQTILPNFPECFDRDVRALTCMDFSPSSGYLALGNRKGTCLLYRLEHYKKY